MKVSVLGGTPTKLASDITSPCALAIDSTNVYWSSSGTGWIYSATGQDDGAIWKVPIAGGVPTTLAVRQNRPCGITVDGTTVFWRTANGAVLAAPLTGGTPKGVSADGSRRLFGDVVDGASIYWSHGLKKRQLGGGPETELLAAQRKSSGRSFLHDSCGAATDRTHVYAACYTLWITPRPSPTTSGSVHIDFGLSLLKVPLAGGPPTDLLWTPGVEGVRDLGGIAVDDSSVYWLNVREGTVMKLTPK
jgi:hypothetical protein